MSSNQLTLIHASRTGSSVLCSQGGWGVPVWQSLQPVVGSDSSAALVPSGLTHLHLLHQVTVLPRLGAGPTLLSIPALMPSRPAFPTATGNEEQMWKGITLVPVPDDGR